MVADPGPPLGSLTVLGRMVADRTIHIQFFQGQIINCSLLGLFQYCLEWELNSRPWIGRGLYTVTCFTTRPKNIFVKLHNLIIYLR